MSETTPIQVYLTVKGGESAIEFYKKAFGAKEAYKQKTDDGVRLLHANLNMFGGQVMLSDEFPEHSGDVVSPLSAGKASVTIHVNLKDAASVDQTMAQAAKAGAIITMPVDNMFWGMRYGRVRDPFGHVWSFGAPAEKRE
ncbi:MAG TPA: VOC family protein [Aestuariivirgaceae bacterium]|jgi:PhnB protein